MRYIVARASRFAPYSTFNSQGVTIPQSFFTFDPGAYSTLSLSARLAIALHCFARYCKTRQLEHPEIDEFLDHLWDFPIIIKGPDEFTKWEAKHANLIYVGLGDDYPLGFGEFLQQHGVSPHEFRELLGNVVEVIFSSFYGQSDDKGSLEYLHRVIDIVGELGIVPPSPLWFASSQFCDHHGFGKPLTCEERDAWRVGYSH